MPGRRLLTFAALAPAAGVGRSPVVAREVARGRGAGIATGLVREDLPEAGVGH